MSKFVHPGWTRPPGPVGCWLCSFPNADDAASQEKTPKHPRLEPRGASTTAPTSPAGTPPPRQPASLRGPPGRAERDSPRSPSSRAGDSGRGRRVAAPGGSAALTDPGGVQGPLPRRRAGVSGWSQRSPRSPGQSYMTGRAFIHPHHRHRGNSRSFSVDYLLIFKAPLRVSVATCERCLLCWAVGDRGRFRQQVTLSRQRPLCSDAPRLPHGAGAEHLGASLRGPRKTLTATRHQGNGRGEHRPNTLGWL
ncbi:collagen alpha-1(I) chain-like [Camelus ferus]|uniref:Collagen alpha-1(I) chain-like n=1 Tax=Camelus ferus TaxID=419612 RepID=A0A8B8RHR3_CAMFR|nr:collagen alpha-1(I) chain-like [Camelus ferus]